MGVRLLTNIDSRRYSTITDGEVYRLSTPFPLDVDDSSSLLSLSSSSVPDFALEDQSFGGNDHNHISAPMKNISARNVRGRIKDKLDTPRRQDVQ